MKYGMDKKLVIIWCSAAVVAAVLSWWLLRPVRDDAAVSSASTVRVLLEQEGGGGLGMPQLSEEAGLVVVGDAQGRVWFWELGDGSGQPKKNDVTLGTAPIAAAPTLARDDLWLVGDEGGVMHCFMRSGQSRWQFKTGDQILGEALVYGNLVIFGSYDQSLYAVGLEDGQERWRQETGGYINGRPVLEAENGWLIIGNCEGKLVKFSAADGSELASLDLGSPIPETPVLDRGLCLALTHSGELVAVDIASFTVTWRVQSEGSFVSSPAIIGSAVVLTTSAGLVHVYWPESGKWQHDVTDGMAVTPVAGGSGSVAYGVTTDGQLLRFVVADEVTTTVLHDFQRDCDQGAVVGARHVVFAALDGTLIVVEVQ